MNSLIRLSLAGDEPYMSGQEYYSMNDYYSYYKLLFSDLNKDDEQRIKKMIEKDTFSITENSDFALTYLVTQKSRQRAVERMKTFPANYSPFLDEENYLENMVTILQLIIYIIIVLSPNLEPPPQGNLLT